MSRFAVIDRNARVVVSTHRDILAASLALVKLPERGGYAVAQLDKNRSVYISSVAYATCCDVLRQQLRNPP